MITFMQRAIQQLIKTGITQQLYDPWQQLMNSNNLRKHHSIKKEQKVRFSKFVIRPPFIEQPIVRIQERFNTFKINVKKANIEMFKIKIKDYSISQNVYTSNNQTMQQVTGGRTQKQQRSITTKKQKDKQNIWQNKQDLLSKERIRQVNTNRKTNLVDCTLKQVIYLNYKQGLMLNQYYDRFVAGFNQKEQFYLYNIQSKPLQNRFQSFFSLIDHRYFAQLLMKLKHQKYEIRITDQSQIQDENERPQSKSSIDIRWYYKKLHQLSFNQYFSQWQKFNIKFARNWMPKNLTQYRNIQYFNQILPIQP